MRRRDFVGLVGGAAAWPVVARAQQRPATPVIGYLYAGSPETSASLLAAFRKGLNEAGFIEGRNVAIEFRWARTDLNQLPALAADLVQRRVAIIAAPGSLQAALAAKAATTTIPVVFSTGADPVLTGLVASLNRPGANVTGISYMNVELSGKRLGLLRELVPKATRMAALFGVTSQPFSAATQPQVKEMQAAAASIGRELDLAYAGTNREIDTAFAEFVQRRVEALVVTPTPLFFNRRVQIISLAARHAIPVIYFEREFAEAGGLMSYGSSNADRDRQMGIYVARVLRGEKPADLPVMQPTKFEFIINGQTARLLGIEVPPTLLAITDEVIE